MSGYQYGTAVLPTVVDLDGHEPPVSQDLQAQVFWLLRRYTSLIYLERQYVMLTKVIEGLKGEASRASDPFTVRWFMSVLAVLYRHEAEYEKGLKLLRKGNQRGYNSILEGAAVSDYLSSRTFYEEDDYRWFALGSPNDRPLVGLLAWGRRLYTMTSKTLITLRTEWTYQRFQEPALAESPDVFPKPLAPAPFPAPGAPQCSPGDVVPVGGVWWPIDRRLGCPNYMVSQSVAPEAMSTISLLEDPTADPAAQQYIYERRPSRWELVWEDDRYAGGNIPEEVEYLSDDIKLPQEPLQLLPFP